MIEPLPSSEKERRTLRYTAFAAAVIAVVGLAMWAVFRLGPPDAANGAIPAEAALRFFELKNTGIAALENAEGSDDPQAFAESESAFAALSEELPEELLGHRNLAITRLLIVKEGLPAHERERHRPAIERAQATLEHLRQAGDDPALVHRLAAHLARRIGDEEQMVEELERAAELAPEDPVVWRRLFEGLRYARDEDLQERAYAALARAHELRPDNLWLLKERLILQAQRRDPEFLATIDEARHSLQPFVESIRWQTRGQIDNVLEFVDEAADAARQGDDAGWQRARAMAHRIEIAVRTEVATQIDDRLLDPHPLEHVLLDFSPDFYGRAELPAPERPEPIAVRFVRAPDERQLPPLEGVRAVRLADFDLDGRLDVIVLREESVEVYGREAEDEAWTRLVEAEVPPGMRGIVAADLDRDFVRGFEIAPRRIRPVPADERREPDEPLTPRGIGSGCHDADLDLIVYGEAGVILLRNAFDAESGRRVLERMPQEPAFEELRDVLAVAAADLDHDGDLDLIVSTRDGLSFWSNREGFTFAPITGRSMLPPADLAATAIVPVDWNRDVAIDMLLAGPGFEEAGLMENMFHARFRWRPFDPEFGIGPAAALAVADVDGNASWDVIAAGAQGITAARTRTRETGVVRPLEAARVSDFPATGLLAWDYDNDGHVDLLSWNEEGIEIHRGGPGGRFERVEGLVDALPERIAACDVGDIEGDGDLDLLIAGPDGVVWYSNEGGNRNHWIDLALRAEIEAQDPKELTNMHGIGSLIELRVGPHYQAQVASRQITRFGLGQRERADAIRVLWTNGIPQNVAGSDVPGEICMEQKLKGSCPYLYTWAGERFEFFTDCLWSAPLGLQFAEGVLAPSREWEYLLIPGDRLVPKNGEYVVQLTEELWEAAYFDAVKLIAVDHPADVEIFSNEKVGPAEIAPFRIHTVRRPRLPAAARDLRGRDVLPWIARRDKNYLKAFDRRIKQGLTEEHWIELDLGELDEPQRITLFLTGWVMPTDTSLNIAISQNPGLEGPKAPSLWVPAGKPARQGAGRASADGAWIEAVPYTGFPGGKTKTIAVEVPPEVFPEGDHRVRLVTSMELYWDQVFFTVDEEDAPVTVTELLPRAADLHYRGFSRRIESAGYGPEDYDYEDVTAAPQWPPMLGRFTRYGDVTELILEEDDLLVVMGAGDEMTVRFPVPEADPPEGWTRSFLLYNVGWDKDADLNTIYGQTAEPLPFRGMDASTPEAETRRNSRRYQEYLRTYQTRTQSFPAFWRQLAD